MAFGKRKTTKPVRRFAKKRTSEIKLGKRLLKVVKKQINKRIETKQYTSTVTDGIEILHNDFQSITSTPFYTTNGTGDGDVIGTNQVRIGDEVTAIGWSLKMMVELNERFSDVTFRLLFVKCAKGDIPTRATLFRGNSGNKMIDDLNTERYTILGQKWFKMKSPNSAAVVGGVNITSSSASTSIVPGTLSGVYIGDYNGPAAAISRATKIVRMYIPAKKFTRNGKFVYENGSPQPKFFDYHCVLYAYSNFTTSQDYYEVGRINDTVHKFYFKDA